jgi:hypothetical protein
MYVRVCFFCTAGVTRGVLRAVSVDYQWTTSHPYRILSLISLLHAAPPLSTLSLHPSLFPTGACRHRQRLDEPLRHPRHQGTVHTVLYTLYSYTLYSSFYPLRHPRHQAGYVRADPLQPYARPRLPHTPCSRDHSLGWCNHQVLYSYCTRTVLTALYCTRTVLVLYPRSILYSYCPHGSILYSYCTHGSILYSYCTHTVLILYSHCTHALYPTALYRPARRPT